MVLLWSLVAVGVAYLASVAFHAALGWTARWRIAALAALACPVTLAPLLIPAHAFLARVCAAIYAGVLVLKMWDLHVGAGHGERPRAAETLAFMANVMSLVHRRKGLEDQPAGWRNVGALVRALLIAGVAYAVMMQLVRIDWSSRPFLAEHAFKATTFFVFTTGFFEALAALTRGVGGYATSPVDRPLLARTPAEFWRRYNRTVGEFLREDVFRASGGRHRPVRATLLVFAVSAALHEYVFTVGRGTVQGYQTAFFLVQGAGVALTLRAKPDRVVGVAATLGFNLITSVLFFASFGGMLYQGDLPGWLWGS